MNVRALLEEKAKALAEHDGLVIAAVTHLIAAANEIVAEARRELDALIASLAPAPVTAPVAEVEQPAPEPAPSPEPPAPAPEPQPEAPAAPEASSDAAPAAAPAPGETVQ